MDLQAIAPLAVAVEEAWKGASSDVDLFMADSLELLLLILIA